MPNIDLRSKIDSAKHILNATEWVSGYEIANITAVSIAAVYTELGVSVPDNITAMMLSEDSTKRELIMFRNKLKLFLRENDTHEPALNPVSNMVKSIASIQQAYPWMAEL